jgi:protein-glutamine gamma-glutamyltransferase
MIGLNNQRWATLPRDTRDTLFLLAVIAWSVLPQTAHLPLWCSALVAAVLTVRGWLAWQQRPLPSKWWLALLLVASVAATWFTHRTLLGRDAGVTLVVILLALKTLELRARRDTFVVFFLGFFALLTNFLFSQSLLTALAMLAALLGWLTALVNAHMPVGKPPLWQAGRIAAGMTLLGAPMMAVLFVLFPRLAPLWGLPSDAMAGRSGLSASMTVGQIASLALDDSIALRVRFDGAPPPAQAMYFRGPVLSHFDGRSWQPVSAVAPRLGDRLQTAPNLRVQGPPVRYEVTLEPNNRPWVFVLEAAAAAPKLAGQTVTMTADLQWISSQIASDLVRYSAESYPDFAHGPTQRAPALFAYTLLPEGSNPRTRQLARELAAQTPSTPADRSPWVNAAMQHLRNGSFSYTLEPGTFGQHTADEFWFDKKQGFCEHIASSFVILMRALDIPARIVTGYQGGEINPVDGFWTVRQSDAHAWAEVWLADRGWARSPAWWRRRACWRRL